MSRPPQKRRVETRARLLAVAEEVVEARGASALRVEDVVAQAGVAKGTLFAHFGDKDGLLSVIVGARLMAHLDALEAAGPPESVADLAARLDPMMAYIASDRLIFDLILRYSGATGASADAVMTRALVRQTEILAGWIAGLAARGQAAQADPMLLAQGVQAFMTQLLAVGFCDAGASPATAEALRPYLDHWLR